MKKTTTKKTTKAVKTVKKRKHRHGFFHIKEKSPTVRFVDAAKFQFPRGIIFNSYSTNASAVCVFGFRNYLPQPFFSISLFCGKVKP